MNFRDELLNILEAERLTTLFQPIVNTADGRIYGYEALTRGPSDSPLHAPLSLFGCAARAGVLVELEAVCWRIACRSFRELELPGKLFLNASPFGFVAAADRLIHEIECCIAPERVVIELTEQHPIDDFDAVRTAARTYKARGLAVAIDDLGAGYSGLRLWSELRPDYVKIDSHFVQDLHKDPIKQEFVRSIQDIALGIQCRVIAEGIETEGEHQIVSKLGVTLGQGYYFARPTATPPLALADRYRLSPESAIRRLSGTVGTLALTVAPVTPDTHVETVMDLFTADEELQTVPVVKDSRPAGVVRRARLMKLYVSRYGRELHGKKPVNQFMDAPFAVEHDQPVERVSLKLTEQFELEQDFVITRDGHYLGIGRVRDLLKTITELQIRNARYANPLTLLPGNVPIHEHIDALLLEKAEFTVCYCDLDSFKPFNDVHGYTAGDEVIKKLAEVLSAHVDRERDFVGHIGGDDFILVLRSENWQQRCEDILRHFNRDVVGFYAPGDLAQGGIWAHDRRGHPVFYPLLTLSIGAVRPDPNHCRSHHEVAGLATDAKREAKKLSGNSLFIDRRRSPAAWTQGEPVAGEAAEGAPLWGLV